MKSLFCVISFLSSTAWAGLDRIQSVRVDKGQVQRIYLAPGLGSVLLFPCALQEVFIGRSEDLKAQISPNDKKTLFLNLKLNSSLPTNVIVKCSPDNSIFVFDVIPNRSKHQDLVEIRSSYGRPNYQGGQRAVETSRSRASGKFVVQAPVLIQKGERK